MTLPTVARAYLVRWRWYLCGAGAACTLLWTLYFLSLPQRPTVIPRPHTFSADNDTSLPPLTNPDLPPSGPPTEAAGNSTLGVSPRLGTLYCLPSVLIAILTTFQFEAILALSPFPSWRTTGLQAAAQFTGLQIQIPPQPPIHPEIIDAFAGLGSEDRTHPNHGSATAWVAHLDLIKHVVQSNYETALILEDDVDWDLSIHEEMVAIAEAVRQLTKTDPSEKAPYGHSWDVLWIGHCGEGWDPHMETIYVNDKTVCPVDKYVGFAKGRVENLAAAQRAVFHSAGPICSFAYALTREGAKKVLLDVGAGKDEAFDIALMNGCRERDLTCISVLPELFRHHIPSKVGGGSLVNSGDGEGIDVEVEMGYTENILESARCHALWGKPCLERDD
ncbi:uncharacterized protein BJX67DRAFT_266820 [Aspergillus lucknowensis]|uniref:Glycosyltransferase family 25 protein n=1 Tax=Aspergillus lucknowensis TaxID=176173 RepID=A0ABR4LF85_9EURO